MPKIPGTILLPSIPGEDKYKHLKQFDKFGGSISNDFPPVPQLPNQYGGWGLPIVTTANGLILKNKLNKADIAYLKLIQKKKKELAAEDEESPTSNAATNVLSEGKEFSTNIMDQVGEFTGYLPKKMGIDFDSKRDYRVFGLGTIGLSFGVYNYYARKNEFKKIADMLSEVYHTNGLHNAAIEDENENLVFINKKLLTIRTKIGRIKGSIHTLVSNFSDPL